MSKQATSNTFTEGLITDLNQLTTPNNILTDCLNGTIITYNGKEFTLQNDMGNAVVERATLPMGYVPLGIKEYNGIVYIVAYNPLEQRVQFGSFPSPEIDFNGEDFDPEDYQLEGVKFYTPDFYTLNPDYPDYTIPDPEENVEFLELISKLTPTAEVIDSIWDSTNPFQIMYWEDSGVNGLPDNIPNKYDCWTLLTAEGELKYKIIKSDIVESFESYEWLKLNRGDRFLIYYIDEAGENYSNVTEILQYYISTETTKKLFKIQVYSVSPTGQETLLNIDPFVYKKEDANLNILNGDLEENVTYNIFDGELNSTIKIKISLEKPESFRVSLKQYSTNANMVRFKTYASGYSFMQIKGFKYDIRKKADINVPEETPIIITGYMRYKKEALYNNFEQTTSVLSYAELLNLPYGVYDYIITPYTQYGYEYSMIASGSFTVSTILVNEEEEIQIDAFSWFKTSPTTLTLTLDTTYELNENEIVINGYLELYDVWSNVSKIIPVSINESSGIMNFNEVFDLTLPLKSFTFNSANFGGISSTGLVNDPQAKLPTSTLNYQGNKILFPDETLVLLPDRIYVLALYYTIEDADSGQAYNKGIYRYFYTNDYLNAATSTFVDLSNAVHPEIQLNLTKGTLQVNKPNSVQLLETSLGINESEYLFDPLMQLYDTTTLDIDSAKKLPYLIAPKEYFYTHYSASNVKLSYYKTLWFHYSQIIYHNISLNEHVGMINCDNSSESAINITAPLETTISADQTSRTILHEGGSTVSSNQVLGEIENLSVKHLINYGSNNGSLIFSSYVYPHKLYLNIVYDYTESDISYTNHLTPFFYNCSQEITGKILNSPDANIHLALTTKHLDFYVYKNGVLGQQTRPIMDISCDDGADYALNTASYCNDGGRGYFVADTFKGYNKSLYLNTIATPYNGLPGDFQTKYTELLKNYSNVGTPYMLNLYTNMNGTENLSQLFALNTLDTLNLTFLELNSDQNLVNPLLFVGGYALRSSISLTSDQEYKLFNANLTKKTYEGSDSKVKYNLTSNFKYKVLNKSAYKVYFPAIDTSKLIALTNDILKNYITQRFDFLDYDGGDLIPKLQIKSENTISFGELVEINSSYSGVLMPPSNLDHTNYLAEHPTMNTMKLNEKYHVVGSLFFEKSSKQFDSACENLYALNNLGGTSYCIRYDNASNQVVFDRTTQAIFTNSTNYEQIKYFHTSGSSTPYVVLTKYKLYT